MTAAGIPRVYWCGVDQNIGSSVIMIMDMLGPNLEDLFQLCDKNFSLKTVLMLADQMVWLLQIDLKSRILPFSKLYSQRHKARQLLDGAQQPIQHCVPDRLRSR
jgi:hypothetical protein